MTLAKRFKDARTSAGLTQVRLGELACSTQDVVQKIENGKSLRPRNIESFSKVLGVSSAWLQYGENHPSPIKLSKDEQQIISLYKQLKKDDKQSLKRILKALAHND